MQRNSARVYRSDYREAPVFIYYFFIGSTVLFMQAANRPLKNVFEAADTRQKQAKKRSLCVINEHFEPVFNTVAATQIVFQRPANGLLHFHP